MPGLKSYTCEKCGAVLSVDKLEGQMACPFCGNEFDLVDFHREELLLQAEECLSRGAYEPAREKFNKVLENDPTDIVAYRGLILCAGRVQSTEDLRDRYKQAGGDLDAIRRIVASANGHVTRDDADYLDKLVSLFEIPKAYKDIKSRRDNTRDLEKKRELQLEVNKERDKTFGVVFGISIYVEMGLIILLAASCELDIIGEFGRIILIAAMIGIIVFVVFLYRRFGVKVVKIPDSSSSLTDKMEYVEDKHLEILDEVLEYEEGFRKKPGEKTIGSEDKTQEPETEIAVPIICAKCGGQLKLNNSQELYECNSCGVSYGKYLFFGDLTENAVKAMNIGEFDEADQILSHKLMLNPKDFDALFGRFLCAGRWKSLKDIDVNDSMFSARVKKLPDQLDAIEKKISLEDQPLWKDIRTLSDILTEYSVRRHAFNRVNEKYKSVCGKLNNTYLLPEEVTDYKRQENELREQVTSLEGECDEVKVRIDEAVKILTDAESTCVFF